MAGKPKLLQIPSLPKIHAQHPEVGQAIKIIVEYLNQNLSPKQGNKQS